MARCIATLLALIASLMMATSPTATAKVPSILGPFANPSGEARTVALTGSDTNNPFFQSLGTNGRACVTCHQAAEGWSITPAGVQERFAATAGLDPLFRLVDGANAPNADVSTLAARRAAYSMLLSKGLIRIGIGIPANAEFELVGVNDPYGYANTAKLSLFRRPLPATNLRFLSAVMWDGRQTLAGRTIREDLLSQANDATLSHAQAVQALTPQQREQIVNFALGLHTAQVTDNQAGKLDWKGAGGSPETLAAQEFYLGINDPLGLNPTGAPFNRVAFTLYATWATINGQGGPNAARSAVSRGATVFNTRQFNITGVKGLNDELGVMSIVGTCTTCHNSPNVGNHSVAAPLDIGIADAARRTPDMPLYTLRHKTTGATVQTTDPGRALITGKWKDIGRFKGPILRGLAARAPYFHNGSAATLTDVVTFYNARFSMGLTAAEIADLVAFLRTL
jgi:cytochrome c peroxidase